MIYDDEPYNPDRASALLSDTHAIRLETCEGHSYLRLSLDWVHTKIELYGHVSDFERLAARILNEAQDKRLRLIVNNGGNAK
jgi:hypothetical protein